MNFDVDTAEEELRSEVLAVTDQFDEDYWLRCDMEHRYPQEFFDAFRPTGLIGVSMSKEYGGRGLGMAAVATVVRAIAGSGAGLNGCSTVHQAMFALKPLEKYASDELKQLILPQAARGEARFSFGITEAKSGIDTTTIQTFAKRVDGGYLINGAKLWLSNVRQAKYMVLLTRTTPQDECEKRTDGMSLFIADIDLEHMQIAEIAKMGRNAVESNRAELTDLFVSEDRLVGEEGRGFYYLLDGLNSERVMVAAEALGIGYLALDHAVRYANERIVFGRPIGQNQAIQGPLALAQIQLDAADLMMRKAAWLLDRNVSCGREANSAKYLAAEAAFFAANRAVQTFGGMGYARENHVERYFRETRLFQLGPVSQEMVLNFVAERVMGLPRSY